MNGYSVVETILGFEVFKACTDLFPGMPEQVALIQSTFSVNNEAFLANGVSGWRPGSWFTYVDLYAQLSLLGWLLLSVIFDPLSTNPRREVTSASFKWFVRAGILWIVFVSLFVADLFLESTFYDDYSTPVCEITDKHGSLVRIASGSSRKTAVVTYLAFGVLIDVVVDLSLSHGGVFGYPAKAIAVSAVVCMTVLYTIASEVHMKIHTIPEIVYGFMTGLLVSVAFELFSVYIFNEDRVSGINQAISRTFMGTPQIQMLATANSFCCRQGQPVRRWSDRARGYVTTTVFSQGSIGQTIARPLLLFSLFITVVLYLSTYSTTIYAPFEEFCNAGASLSFDKKLFAWMTLWPSMFSFFFIASFLVSNPWGVRAQTSNSVITPWVVASIASFAVNLFDTFIISRVSDTTFSTNLCAIVVNPPHVITEEDTSFFDGERYFDQALLHVVVAIGAIAALNKRPTKKNDVPREELLNLSRRFFWTWLLEAIASIITLVYILAVVEIGLFAPIQILSTIVVSLVFIVTAVYISDVI